eukprot:CAMPEP_0197362210 /NCGR_PEP_ID=MMETSP0893-20130614/63863_1 /TAXON_ID=44058 ORGANISM="Aureoumbra lagunensis, Strain CCMP1510" /NCGR_SAMPLE_ID=MMETSP0893 /ASSEMBLY_ACC=CAM_ASM_000539 /LENGTH=150 /DNA_ID=CAMNT_0042883931 /DNA_START=377 /DNA_END=829 /DNA_ORIENTATION=+
MLEKHIWISAFMLIGANNQCTVGDVVSNYESEFDELATELAQAGESALNIHLDSGFLPRLKAYAQAVAHFPCAVKEFEWRNGWFFNLSIDAVEQGRPDPLPPCAVKEFEWRNGWFFNLSIDAVEQGRPDPLPIHTSLLYQLNAPLDFSKL